MPRMASGGPWATLAQVEAALVELARVMRRDAACSAWRLAILAQGSIVAIVELKSEKRKRNGMEQLETSETRSRPEVEIPFER